MTKHKDEGQPPAPPPAHGATASAGPPPAPVAPGPGVPSEKAQAALAALAAHKGDLPEPRGRGLYLVTFHQEPPEAVEADAPEDAIQKARKLLGVVSSSAPPTVVKVPGG